MISVTDSYFLSQNQWDGDGSLRSESLITYGKDSRKQVKEFLDQLGIEYTISWGGYYLFCFDCTDAQWDYIKEATQEDLPAEY